NSEDEETKV
ncbi:hypothetical protein CMV_012162, partial [Castanea mollissima]